MKWSAWTTSWSAMTVFESLGTISTGVIKKITLQCVVALKARCWTHTHLANRALVDCFHSLNMYFTVSVSISCHRMVKLLAVKADILYCYIASRKVVPSKRISSYQFPHKILFEFDKGDSRMAVIHVWTLYKISVPFTRLSKLFLRGKKLFTAPLKSSIKYFNLHHMFELKPFELFSLIHQKKKKKARSI